MDTTYGTTYVDPVGKTSAYAEFPAADLLLVTHEHGDHFNLETRAAVIGDSAQIITNPAVYGKLADDLKNKASLNCAPWKTLT